MGCAAACVDSDPARRGLTAATDPGGADTLALEAADLQIESESFPPMETSRWKPELDL